MQHISCFIALTTATENAKIAKEPPVEPNCKRIGARSITCVWKTPINAAMETSTNKAHTAHFVIMQLTGQVFFLERMAITKKEGNRQKVV